jgi:hypothetical protein
LQAEAISKMGYRTSLIFFVLAFPQPLFATDYTFTRIVDNTDPVPYGTSGTYVRFGAQLDSIFPPAIDQGTVLYEAAYNSIPGGDRSGIFTNSNGATQTVVSYRDSVPGNYAVGETRLPFDWVEEPRISNGTVAYFGQYINLHGAFTWTAGVGSPFTDTPLGNASVDWSNSMGIPAINGDEIAYSWIANSNAQFGKQGQELRLRNSTGKTTIARAGDPAPAGTFNYFYNDYALSHDNVVFRASFNNYAQDGIFVGNGGALTKIVATGDAAPAGTFTSLSHPAISNHTTAFWAAYGSPVQEGIFSSNGDALVTIAKTGDIAPSGGAFTHFQRDADFQMDGMSGPSIVNDTVAFQATTTQGTGIYVSAPNQLTTVITTGESLFGSPVATLLFGNYGLDADGSGRLAFRYTLADGRFGVATATVVPEPNLLSAAIICLAITARRARRGIAA